LSTAALASLAFLGACSSTTTIMSRPSGARLYLNGEAVGVTPYAMTDTKIIGSTTTVRLELPGYETTNAAITRNEQFDAGACIGGVFLLFPFLWIQGYNPTHIYELRSPGGGPGDAWGGAAPYPNGGYGPPPGYPPAPGYAPPPGYPPPPANYPPAPPPRATPSPRPNP